MKKLFTFISICVLSLNVLQSQELVSNTITIKEALGKKSIYTARKDKKPERTEGSLRASVIWQ